MKNTPNCSKCGSSYVYEDNGLYICPECSYEWAIDDNTDISSDSSTIVRDAHGNILNDGDCVTIVKDLKVKGTSSVVKVGTKVKNIRINLEGNHNIDCKIAGVGNLGLKSEFVKKS